MVVAPDHGKGRGAVRVGCVDPGPCGWPCAPCWGSSVPVKVSLGGLAHGLELVPG